jgi:hypothetical protein
VEGGWWDMGICVEDPYCVVFSLSVGPDEIIYFGIWADFFGSYTELTGVPKGGNR